jgi:transposase-like protein
MSMKIFSDETAQFRETVARLKERGMNVTKIAATLGVHHNTVAGWMCGSIRISPSRLAQAKALL